MENDLLVNGKYYFESNPNANGHAYFLSNNWNQDWISIEGVKFKNVDYKLDVIDDKLIYKYENSEGVTFVIELNPLMIDSFYIGNHLFISNTCSSIDKNYIELVYNGKLKLYRTYQKFFKKIYNNYTPYGQITEIDSKNFIVVQEKVINANKRNDFLFAFKEENRKIIKNFLRKNKINYTKATNSQLTQLMEFCDDL